MVVNRQQHCPAFIIFIAEIISSIWLEHNSVVFRRDQSTVPPLVIWGKTVAQLEALSIRSENTNTPRLIQSNV